MTKTMKSKGWIFDSYSFMEYRKSLGLNRKEMAQVLSMSERTIKAWELEQNTPSDGKVLEIANCLRIPVDSIAVPKEDCLLYVKNRRQQMSSTFLLIKAKLEESMTNVGQELSDEMIERNWEDLFPLISRTELDMLFKNGEIGQILYHLYGNVMNRVSDDIECILNEIECSRGENNNSISV